MTEYDLAIIGAGTAGLHAYRSAVAGGANVVMIERGERGSTCTATGCIPSKLLLASARAAVAVRDAATFGVVCERYRVDGAAVMTRLRADRDRRDDQVRDESCKIPHDHRIRGTARFLDRHRLQVEDGPEIHARAVIVATGSSPVVPPFLEPVAAFVRTNETIFEVERPPASLAVIGVGPLGLELAQAFARLGTRVTVLDKTRTIGALADPEAETCVREALSGEIDFRLGVDIEATAEGDAACLRWSGDETGEARFDLILAATGRAPALATLDLGATGLALDEDGVPCFDPDTRRCGDSDIFLAGDVGAWRTVLHEAARGGTIAGEQATGQAPRRRLPEIAVAFTEPNIATVGTAYDALPDGAVIGMAWASDNARAGIDGDGRGVVRLYADRAGRLLGGSIVLTGGEHLAQTLALAIDAGFDVERFADQAWYHPVLEELLHDAARDAIGKLR